MQMPPDRVMLAGLARVVTAEHYHQRRSPKDSATWDRLLPGELSLQHTWISQSPFNVMQPAWNGNPCPPTNGTEASGTCNSLLGDPVYVINVTDASQVEAGVKFAAKYNIRLIVKNTGHEFLGR
ncbi:hypothetical protein ABW21_db0202335 [Orbilia brochopaga]|nr:hypothetical protein ABW21_db0202335 [Drechslerella brochopaga]